MLATEPARGAPVAELLARHESALRLARSALLVDWVTDEALTLGAAQPEASACAFRARSMGLPTHRRGSGGTGVYLGPGDVAWAVVLPRTDPRLRGGFCSGYASLGAGVVELLTELGTPSRWVPSRGTDPDLCFLGPRGEVLEVGGRVFGGAAQHVTGAALLHEGVLPSQARAQRLGELFDRPSELLRERLGGYGELPGGWGPNGFSTRLREALGRSLGIGPAVL